MLKESERIYPGGVTQKQLDEWVASHGAVNDYVKRGAIENLSKPGGKLYFYFRKPDKGVIALAMARGEEGGKKTPMKSNDVLRQNCLLFAEDGLLTDPVHKGEYEVAMGKVIGDAFPIPDAEIEKI
jgi:hypothetical protein